MDTRTGEIGMLDEMKKRIPEEYLVPVDPQELPPRKRRQLERTGRTQISPRHRCPCGSGHRFKHCCMSKEA